MSTIEQPLGVGGAAHASAMLEVSANDKGILIPRMSSAQRNAIASPATGLLVFDTTVSGFVFFNGNVWVNLAAGGISSLIADADGNTKIQVEETPNEDVIRFDLGGTERLTMRKNPFGRMRLEFPDSFANVILGVGAGAHLNSGLQNIAMGSFALGFNTAGGNNIAIGNQALGSTTTGNNNTGVGSGALFSNGTGNSNTAHGSSSLSDNSTGDFNTASGVEALDANITGDANTAVGYQANVATGNLTNATAIGANALVSASNSLVLGSIGGLNGASHSVNVGIGTTAPNVRLQVAGGADVSFSGGGYIMAGTADGTNIVLDDDEIMARNNGLSSDLALNASAGNVGIGTSSPEVKLHIKGGTDASLAGGGFLVIGSTSLGNIVLDNNEIMARNGGAAADLIFNNNGGRVGIGRTPNTNILEVNGAASKSSAGDWLANSDARLKKNITPLDSRVMLKKLLALQGVTYEWNDLLTGSDRPEGIQFGFTAQNIQTVFPTLVEKDNLGYLQTAYGTFDAMTVEAIRALNDKIEAQKEEIERLKKCQNNCCACCRSNSTY